MSIRLDRRAVLRSLGVVAGVGAAGCFGSDTSTPATESDPGDTTDQSPGESPSPTTEATPTYTTICGVCVDSPDLIAPDEPTTEATAGETTTIPATFRNQYDFAVEVVGIVLTPPSEEWGITPPEIAFESVAAGSDREIEWVVSIPETATGAYTLTTVTTIRGPRTDHTIRTNNVDVQVTEP